MYESRFRKYYLPPKSASAPNYTLLLDLDETLLHYAEHNNLSNVPKDIDEPVFFIRSGLFQFLTQLAPHYELVLFTAAERPYADYFL